MFSCTQFYDCHKKVYDSVEFSMFAYIMDYFIILCTLVGKRNDLRKDFRSNLHSVRVISSEATCSRPCHSIRNHMFKRSICAVS